MNSKNIFWRDDRFPFIEIRKTSNSKEVYKIHSHDNFLSIGAVESGDIMMQCSGENLVVTSGMLVFFNPNEPHSCNPLNGIGRSYWMMHLDAKWCLAIQREMFGDVETLIPVDASMVEDRELFGDCCEICSMLTSSEDFFDVDYELIRFFSQIFGKYCTGQRLVNVPNVVIEEVAEYLTNNPFENISLDGLADKFRQNRFHLLRSFKDVYGLPPHSFQMNLRIEKAKGMLRDGLSIADTAQATGFVDQSHFHRIFKKHTAATPGEYRNTI